ncbi:hypothetical protein P43SY_008993 [Pythium insidiosum]|uniref:Kinesin-like protein n=1 Tax=Pythium insidiosum TaxID=114742 RepID=A0AAD5LWX0_PYTIN|nr:hypothetical protein P43SY_008993 [Pythium insidiosum]
MVLPSSSSSAASAPGSPTSVYAAGHGHVLSHFAGLTTPEPVAPPARRSKVTLRQRPTASISTSAASSPFDITAPLDGAPSSNQDAVHNLVLPTPVLQDMFTRQRDENASQRRRRGADGASAAKKDDGADDGDDSNQQPDAASQPEKEKKAGTQVRMSGSNGSSSRSSSLLLDGSFSSDSYSLLSSIQFITRDLHEDQRANTSQSDRERAFLYKKRYTDVYGLAVGLANRVTELEQLRASHVAQIRGLRDTLSSQSTALASMAPSSTGDAPPSHGEREISRLCREVGQLARQLNERDSYIESLQTHGRDDSGRLRASDLDVRSTVERVERERDAALEELEKLRATLQTRDTELAAAHAERLHLQNSMERTEQELEAVHTQWLKEKSDLLEALDDSKRQQSAECEALRRENAQLRQSSDDRVRQLEAALEKTQRALDDGRRCIARLETEARDLCAEQDARVQSLTAQLQLARADVERLSSETAELSAQHSEALAACEAACRERMEHLERRILQGEVVRRSLHNKVMELKGNIRVFCRVRPVLKHEAALNGTEEIFQFPDDSSTRRQIELLASPRAHVGYGQNGGKETVKKYPFDFDLVFNGQCTQEEIFLEVSALIQSALDGFNVCIFAYGQTGSGKTFTMQGGSASGDAPTAEMGIVGRGIAHIFATIADLRSSGWDFGVSVEMIEIYNETLRDLLAPAGSADKVELRLDTDGKPVVTNSCVHAVEDERAAWRLLQKAMGRRATKTTNMNDRSSRSHSVISFRLNGVNALTGERRTSVVHLVDLAGSERLSKSGSGHDKEMLKEAQCINRSLSALGNVICALAKRSGHVPFRDSKLTHFLSPALGGDSKTLMICTLSPLRQHRDETLNSLRFAKTVNSCEIALPSYGNRS